MMENPDPAPADAPEEGAELPQPQLDRVEERVVACLVEKAITTPDYYPMTLNGLTTACRQKSNRNPVVDVDEQTVATALERLQERGLTRVVTGADQRVPKYRHLFADVYRLQAAELAILCELMLRGPQTVGELRSHASRMHPFEELEPVDAALQGHAGARLARGDLSFRSLIHRDAAVEVTPSEVLDSVLTGVGRDAVQPGVETAFAAVGGDRPVQSHEDLLRQIFGLLTVADHTQREGEHAILVEPNQLFERPLVAALETANQLAIAYVGGRTVGRRHGGIRLL